MNCCMSAWRVAKLSSSNWCAELLLYGLHAEVLGLVAQLVHSDNKPAKWQLKLGLEYRDRRRRTMLQQAW